MSGNLEKHLFQLKLTTKTLQRNSRKCTKEEGVEKTKLKKAIQQGNMEGAKIYASNAIRKKNEALNMLRLASRIDAVASRVQTAASMQLVTKNMASVVTQMDKAMASMNLEKISIVMGKFEDQFESMDVQTSTMEQSISSTTAVSTPQNEVDLLMQQVADEHGLELNMELGSVPSKPLPSNAQALPQQRISAPAESEELVARLSKLRNPS